MEAPPVTVITTVYNRARYLPTAIESVLAQRFADFEYLIVDDASTDDSAAIAQAYAGRDARIRVVVNQRNLGDYANRNVGARLARGRFLKYADSDDLLYPHALESMVRALTAFPDCAYALATPPKAGLSYPCRLAPSEAYALFARDGRIFQHAPVDALIDREALLSIGGFPEVEHADLPCWLKLSQAYPLLLVPAGLAWWRRHDQQASEDMHRPTVRHWRLAWSGYAQARAAWSHPACPASRLLRAHMTGQLLLKQADEVGRAVLKGHGREIWRGAREARRIRVAFDPPSTPWTARDSTAPSAGHRWPMPGMAVDVVLPACNAARTIREAIASVRAQTFGGWRLLVLDDASDDGTFEAAVEAAGGDPRIRVVRNERRLGRWANHNAGLAWASSPWVKFLHADDRLYPEALRHGLFFAGRHPACSAIQLHEWGVRLTPCEMDAREVWLQEFFGFVALRESPTGLFYRRDALAAIGGFEAECPWAGVRAHMELALRAPILLIHGGLAYYARGSRQLRVRGPGMLNASAGERAWLRTLLDDPRCPLTPDERAAAVRNLERAAHGGRAAGPMTRLDDRHWGPLYRSAGPIRSEDYPP